MVVFLNFAPIKYLGGAERKIYELFTEVKKHEESKIIDVSSKVTNIYSSLVLGLRFEDRDKNFLKFDKNEHLSLSFINFIPLTKGYLRTRKILRDARIIYFKSDINEILILIYFGGFKILSKSVAGIRSPWMYQSPVNYWDNFHNFVYKSSLINYLMRKMMIIHVLTERDDKYFKEIIKAKNTIQIATYASQAKFKKYKKINNNKLRIIFVGELVKRKGVDVLIEVIQHAPKHYFFNVVGKGPMEKEVRSIARNYDNCKYWGYLSKRKLDYLYSRSDVLVFPSRAEGFGGVVVEAMSHGLRTIDSPEVGLGMANFLEITVDRSSYEEYLRALNKLSREKKTNRLQSKKIVQYFNKNYSDKIIIPKMLFKLFDLKK